MGNIANDVTQLIGNTPLLRLSRFNKRMGGAAELLGKLEYLNPAGSIKDRVALAMIERAEEDGLLDPGAVIIEPTSGNTGVGLAVVGLIKGYKVILTMPETMSRERIQLLQAYGAEVVLTPGALGMSGAVEEAERIHRDTPGSWIPSQFDNPANPEAHRKTTAQEIFSDTDGSVDIIVAGVGSGGTISGIGAVLKQKKPSVWVAAVEPAESRVLSGGASAPHAIQGIGANFIPGNYDPEVVDEIIPVTGDDAREASRLFAETEGILVGISSGAALSAAAALSKRPENAGKTIVAILPDTGDRYFSTGLFDKD